MMPDARSIALFTRTFFYLRHGETTSNRDQTVAGSLDVELTELGRWQAQTAVSLLSGLGITAIYSSALRRTRETAAIIDAGLRVGITPVPELNERHWGELEGKPRVKRAHGVTTAGAETREQFMARVASGLAMIPAQGVPLIAAHSGTYRVLCRLLGHEESEAPVTNCQPVRIVPLAGGWRFDVL
jgi:2,3-bisphosphoglycerate-dependent phosphoglycerate mutase